MGHKIAHTVRDSRPRHAVAPSAGNGDHPGNTVDLAAADCAGRIEDGMVEDPAGPKSLDACVDEAVEAAPAVPAEAAVGEEQEAAVMV